MRFSSFLFGCTDPVMAAAAMVVMEGMGMTKNMICILPITALKRKIDKEVA